MCGQKTMSYKKNTPEITVIAFDLHGVVSKTDYWQIVTLGMRNPGNIARLALYTFNPFFLKKVYRLWRSHAVAAAYLQMVDQNYPFLKPAVPFLIQVGNAQKPNLPLINFIKKLKQHGYSVHMFSNIGDIILDDFIIKHPDMVHLFDAVCSTKKGHGYTGKPYDAAFINYHSQYNPSDKQVIFIDNTKRNIAAAKRHNMIGILFVNTQNIIQQITKLLEL